MKLVTPFVIVIAALVWAVWLDDTPPAADLVFVNQNDIYTLDPQRMSYLADLRMAHALYEGLLRWDQHTFTVHPAVADLPAISEDGLTYMFTFRPGSRWSNGDPVVAQDFVYAWQRAILPDTAADYSNLFFVIDGAEAFFRWRRDATAAIALDLEETIATPTPRRVRLVIDRLTRLLDAVPPPPAGVARPEDRAAVAAEIAALRQADPATLGARLGEATSVRAWWTALDSASSRAAEGPWTWAQTEAAFGRLVALEALDETHLRVRLTRPVAYFLDLVCFGVFFPVHQPTVEGWPVDHAGNAPPPFAERRYVGLDPRIGRFEQTHGWARPGRHVGNGPYRLAAWRYKRDLRLARNPHYRAPEIVHNDSVLALTIEDTNTAVLAYTSGQIDWLLDVGAEYQADMLQQRRAYDRHHAAAFARLRAEGRTVPEALAALPPPEKGERRDIHAIPAFGVDFFSFNCRPALADGRPNPFARAGVRRAFSLAVDKRAIVDDVTRLAEPVATTLVPPGSIPGYASPAGLGFDRDAARRELADAGWRDRDDDGFVEDGAGTPFPTIDLLYTTNTPRYQWMAIELKAQWESALGVRIELRGTETKFYKEDLKQGKFMIARGRWYGDYGDPTTFLDLCRSTDGNNDRGFASDAIDALLDEAADERDVSRRMALLTECERRLMEEELPLVPICQLVQITMYDPTRVHGISHHPRLTKFLSEIEVTR